MNNLTEIVETLMIEVNKEHLSLLEYAINLGADIRVRGPKRKTLHIFFNDKTYGYINNTILSKGCVLGYYFNPFDHPYPHAPDDIKTNPLRSLCDRYKATVNNFNVHVGTGSNSGRVFVGIVDLSIAKRVIETDTAHL